jgi:hypothetical protein
MGIFPDKKSQRAYAAHAMVEGAPGHGNGGDGGDDSGTTGRFFGDRVGGVERGQTGDVDSDMAKRIVSLAEVREIKEARDTGGMTLSIASALTRWHTSCIFRGGKRFMTTGLGLRRIDALDSEMIAVGYAPIHGIPGRIPDSEVNETARIWAIVESAHPEMLNVVRRLSGMVDEARILSSQMDELRAEIARLQAELKREVPRGIGDQGGGEDSANDEIDSGVMATFIQLWRMAVHRREVAEASLEKALEDRRRANDVNAQLRAQLQEAETQLREQALELEVMRRKESEEAAFRETHPWLAALVERHERPSGTWPQNLRQGYAMMSFLGQHKYDPVRHFSGGPALRDVRRWKLTDLAALKLADRGLDGSPDSLRAVCELLGKVVTIRRRPRRFW